MFWGVLADLVLLIHFAFIIFVLFGGFLVIRWSWLAWVHLPSVIWGAAIEFLGLICPLTPLENWLRHTSGETGYTKGFIEHYILPVVYPTDLTPQIQLFLGFGLVILNLGIYAWVIWWSRSQVRKM